MKHAPATPAISTREVSQLLIQAGIVPENANRIIIDMEVGSAVKIFYSVFADKRLIDVLPAMIANLPVAEMLKHVDIAEPKKDA